MITSILDNDLYKFTMQHAVVKLFPRAKVRYAFINRGRQDFPAGFAELLSREVHAMSLLRLTADEKEYIRSRCYYLPPTYLDFLAGYTYDPAEVSIRQIGGKLEVSIEGYWYRTILWEVPLLALISELYFEVTRPATYPEDEIRHIARNKALLYEQMGAKIADFGTRRRFSYKVHELVVQQFTENGLKCFAGTSNVHFAHRYRLTPIGTHAHEWFMFHAAKYGYKMANKLALENWVNVFRGDLGIALSDTFTSEVFFKAFDTKFAKLFDGVRHDSGDPLEFAHRTIEHYQQLRIDPTTKTIVFSDSLNPEAVERIAAFCNGKVRVSFGIGTNLTNDTGAQPLNIVVKLTHALPEGQDWISTVKLSDARGKYTGETDEIRLCMEVLKIMQDRQ